MREDHPAPATRKWNALLLTAGLLAGACDPATEPQESVLMWLEAVTSISPVAMVGTEIVPPPAVRVTTASAEPVPGVVVSFDALNGGAIANASATTDEQGLAYVGKWTLDTRAGSQTLIASAPGFRAVSFTATAEAGPIRELRPSSGDNQIGVVREMLSQPLLVRALDSFGNPVARASVRFTVTAGGGSIEAADAVADLHGIAASGTWTLGPGTGPQQVKAEALGAETVFSAYAIARPSGLHGQLAFVSGTAGNDEIYLVNADGSGRRRLTTNGGRDGAPTWSPDGSRIAFVSDRDGTPRIYVMSDDGSNVVRRTDGPYDEAPAWSPDGTALAFSSRNAAGVQIVVRSDADPAITFLTSVAGYNSQPSWSPDGRQLVFVSDRDAYDVVFNLYTMHADGVGQALRTRGFGAWPDVPYYFHPVWSPDGSMIAFVHGRVLNGASDMRFMVGLLSADGAFIRDLAWAGDIAWLDSLDPGSVAWSPDGSYIAFTFVDCDRSTGHGCPGERSLRYVSLDGTQEGTIARDARDPSWRR